MYVRPDQHLHAPSAHRLSTFIVGERGSGCIEVAAVLRRREVAELSPECVLANQIDATRDQLADAREMLKSARRRVVQMEEAVANWDHIACELLARRESDGYPVAS